MIMQWINLYKVRKSLKKALAESHDGKPGEAIAILNEIFTSKDFTTNFKIWKSTWQTLGHIANKIEDKVIANDCFAVANDWNNPQLLYQLGYNLVEQSLFLASIPLFQRGLKLQPTNGNMLLELVNSFEAIGRYGLARESLLDYPELLEISFLPRYLMAFYSIMLLDIKAAKEWFDGLDKLCHCSNEEQEYYSSMYEKIKGILRRVDLLSALTPLDAYDLRGWNAVLNSNILLTLSEPEEDMKGRYGYLQESPQFVFECIEELKVLLKHLKFVPDKILAFPDRDSRILAQVTSEAMNCPIEEYSETTKTSPGLIVCYNFNSESVSEDIRILAQEAFEGQILWCHTFDWTKNSLAPDIISYLAQYSTPAWGKRMAIKNMVNGNIIGDKPEIVELSALEGSYEDISKQLQNLIEERPKEENSPILQRLAQHLFCIDGKELSVFNQKRMRSMQMSASPVSSSRFN